MDTASNLSVPQPALIPPTGSQFTSHRTRLISKSGMPSTPKTHRRLITNPYAVTFNLNRLYYKDLASKTKVFNVIVLIVTAAHRHAGKYYFSAITGD